MRPGPCVVGRVGDRLTMYICKEGPLRLLVCSRGAILSDWAHMCKHQRKEAIGSSR